MIDTLSLVDRLDQLAERLNMPAPAEDPAYWVGFHHHRTKDGTPLDGQFEIFFFDGNTGMGWGLQVSAIGYYWWHCDPGCLPTSDPEQYGEPYAAHGPFPTSEGAYLDAIGE